MRMTSGFRVTMIMLFAAIGAGAAMRAPEPDAASQARAQKLINEVFKDDSSRHPPADREALATKMFQQAGRSSDVVERFVLLLNARDLAAEAGSAALANKAIDEIVKSYSVDPLAMRETALTTATRAAKTPRAAKEAADAWLLLAQQALAGGDVRAASRAITQAKGLASASHDPAATAAARALEKALRDAKASEAEYDAAIKKLQEHPDDPEANLVAGRILCFDRNDLKAGLALLAKCADPAIRGTVAGELGALPPAHPDAAGMVAMADGWWSAAAGQHEAAKTAFQSRAAYWYWRAIPQLTGLRQAQAAKRLVEIDAALPGETAGWEVLKAPAVFKDNVWVFPDGGGRIFCTTPAADRIGVRRTSLTAGFDFYPDSDWGGCRLNFGADTAAMPASFVSFWSSHPLSIHHSEDGPAIAESGANVPAPGKWHSALIHIEAGVITVVLDGDFFFSTADETLTPRGFLSMQGNRGKVRGLHWR
ncbi:MAG TPA: hypothetical protein VG269_15310 [Tepidisphaeraceae bacterium]|nr:hypothetical protein [Tepidisphaeraceae bacterium]